MFDMVLRIPDLVLIDQLCKRLIFHRFDPALGVGVQIRTSGRKLQRLYMARFDERTKGICEFRVAVMDEVSTVFKDTPFVHRDIPSNVHHPGFIGMWRDSRYLNATAVEMDKEQHVVSD
jgi:hypothetical protein